MKATHTYPFFATMLGMFYETNWWHVGSLTFGYLFITNLLSQKDSTTNMFAYLLQTYNTKSLGCATMCKIILQ